MNIGLITGVRNARLAVIRDAIDAAATPGVLRLYVGTRPATGAAATPEDLVCSVALQQPCATIDAGVLTFLFGGETPASASGEPTWGRFEDGDGNPVLDGDVGAGELIQVDTVTVYYGGLVSGNVSSTLTEGNP